jgi:hypothetical protein
MRRKHFFPFHQRPKYKNLTKNTCHRNEKKHISLDSVLCADSEYDISVKKRSSFVFEVVENFTIYRKRTELGACFAVFAEKTFTLSNILMDSVTEKHSASNQVTPMPAKCRFHRNFGKKLFFGISVMSSIQLEWPVTECEENIFFDFSNGQNTKISKNKMSQKRVETDITGSVFLLIPDMIFLWPEGRFLCSKSWKTLLFIGKLQDWGIVSPFFGQKTLIV